MDWAIFLGVGAFIIALGSFYLSSSAKFLSIREHETYNTFVKRELDHLSKRIYILEQTRPTTGEIEARLNGTAFKSKTQKTES